MTSGTDDRVSEERKRLGGILRDARTRAGLSRASLATLARVSESTIKNAEAGKAISPATLHCLLAVTELALPDGFRARFEAEMGPGQGISPNAWYAPGFHPLTTFNEMVAALGGAGGHIEQSVMYFDHASAADWFAIAGQTDYAHAQRIMPLDRAAAMIRRFVGTLGVDVIALGPGDGKLETRLMGHIAEHMDHPAGRLYLLDISQPLVSEAYRHASDTLAEHRGITPIAILGDFHRLPQYTQLLYLPEPAPRRQVIVLLGGTFANLDNERRFVRDSLCGFGVGSLMLIDYPGCFGPLDRPEELRRQDPWLKGQGQVAWQSRVGTFLKGPIRRYTPGVTNIELRAELNLSSSMIPGSYSVEIVARVEADGPPRTFSIFRIKRYTAASVIQTFKELGWEHIDGWPYGAEVGYPRTLSLFQRRER